jgi:hypothetical protein
MEAPKTCASRTCNLDPYRALGSARSRPALNLIWYRASQALKNLTEKFSQALQYSFEVLAFIFDLIPQSHAVAPVFKGAQSRICAIGAMRHALRALRCFVMDQPFYG